MYHHSSLDRGSPAWKTKPLLPRYFSLLDLLKNTSDTGVCMLSPFSCVQLFVTLWTTACQAPLSMELSRQKHWSGLPCPPPRDWGGFYSLQAVSSDKGLCHLRGPSTQLNLYGGCRINWCLLLLFWKEKLPMFLIYSLISDLSKERVIFLYSFTNLGCFFAIQLSLIHFWLLSEINQKKINTVMSQLFGT